MLPPDPADDRNVILEIRAGTGGDEAALFAGDLFRMYSRYAEAQGWKVAILDANPAEVGGYKEIVAAVDGDAVFRTLKFESGVHRVQRVPATEAQGRVHTSAASVVVLPEAADSEDDAIVIAEGDLRIDTFRASGAGGQHVNRTDSAVRLTHLPTGIVVACQADRSQHKNRATAMSQLRAKLYERELNARRAEAQAAEEAKSDISWGHQIRSYVLDQSRIKDLRTDVETGNTQAVLDGDLDPFIEASLKSGL
jgi:peptide chain release factor 2